MPPSEGHVDTEEVFVELFAEPGAEDSAGAQVRIDPPWGAYPDQTADQIIGRLESSSAEELATVQLYESVHKARTTVLSAVERQLRIRTDAAKTRPPFLSRTDKGGEPMPEAKTPNERDAKLVQWLTEAYAKEAELEADLTAHIALTQKASYKKRLRST